MRLIEIIIPAERADEVRARLEGFTLVEGGAAAGPVAAAESGASETREAASDAKASETADSGAHAGGGPVTIRLLAEADRTEPLLDSIYDDMAWHGGFRAIVYPIEMTLPRPVEAEADPADAEKKTPGGRINREEIYADLKGAGRVTGVYLATAVLASVVAAIGLYRNSGPTLIGAMVIAPLLGPNMALALGVTLGDLALIRSSFRTNVAGALAAFVPAVVLGMIHPADPATPEIASRLGLSYSDIALGLAAGAAGALAVTSGLPGSLIGVMVAVALVPPLVVTGIYCGAMEPALAAGAFELLIANVVSVNLAAVTVFLLRGLAPANWWEGERARKATRAALIIQLCLLALLAALIRLA